MDYIAIKNDNAKEPWDQDCATDCNGPDEGSNVFGDVGTCPARDYIKL